MCTIAAQDLCRAVSAAGAFAVDQHEAAIEMTDIEGYRSGDAFNCQIAICLLQLLVLETQAG